MIYIKNDSNSLQSVTITNHSGYTPSTMLLRLTNKLDGEVTEFDIYNFKIVKPYVEAVFKLPEGLSDGEYNYNLIDRYKGVLSFGIAVIGDYINNTQSYISESKKIQYKG